MPYQSFESLLKKFPYFLDKKTSSNFSKSEKVFNDEFKRVYNNLYDVYLASKLNKHILIWKVQEEAYNYDMYFHVSLPYLKSVAITKIAEEKVVQEVESDDGTITLNESIQEITTDIYTETYEYNDSVDCFEYLHGDTSQNIIPTEKYLLTVETWDEYTTTKGFPENQVQLNDEYDHDYSIDRFGEFFNVPRRVYTVVDDVEDYPKTIPPYDNQPTEDDYHYLQRLLYYILHLNDTPLPVLEIFKLFSLSDAELLNRERLICRMIDTTRHLKDEVYDREWSPRVWEHKDRWCTRATENLFLFANVNNNTPIQGQSFVFDFKVLNSFAKEVYNTNSYNLINDSIIDEIEDSWIIVPYINGETVPNLFLESKDKWQLTTADIYEMDATFIFKCFATVEDAQENLAETGNKFIELDGDIVSEEIFIKVKGCNDADYYVSTRGNDNNDGTTVETAFKTVTKAVNMVEGEKNIIALLDGEHYLDNTAEITENTTIVSCPQYEPIIVCNNQTFFKVAQDRELVLQNVYLRYSCNKMYSEYTTFRNLNKLNYSLNVYVDERYCRIDTYTTISMPTSLTLLNKYNLTGNISRGKLYMGTGYTTTYQSVLCTESTTKNKEPDYPEFGEKLTLYIDGVEYASTNCDTKGNFSFNIPMPNAWSNSAGMTKTFKVVHDETEYYCKSEASLTRTVARVQPTISVKSLMELVVNEDAVVHADISTPTSITPQPTLALTVYNKTGAKVLSKNITLNNGKASLDLPYMSTTAKEDSYTFKISADNTYLSATATTKIIVAQLSHEIVDYPELINTGDLVFFDNLPSSLPDSDMVVSLDNGDNQLYIVNDESEIPSNLNDKDIVWISDVEDESSINVRIRDKKEGDE